MKYRRKNLGFLGFEHYEVDNLGVVWSRRLRGRQRYTDWHPLRLYPSKDADVNGKRYLTAQLCGEKRKNVLVHHLVLLAFVGPRPFPKAQCRHLDDNPENNRRDNLAWGTQQENMEDLKRNGRFPDRKGEKNSQAKLTRDQVETIRRLYVPRSQRTGRRNRKGAIKREDYLKYSIKKLATMFKVSSGTIYNALGANGHWS